MAPIDGPKPPVPLSILEPHVYIRANVFLYNICVLLSIYRCDGLSLYVLISVCALGSPSGCQHLWCLLGVCVCTGRLLHVSARGPQVQCLLPVPCSGFQ